MANGTILAGDANREDSRDQPHREARRPRAFPARGAAHAETLAVPPNLVDIRSEQGERLLLGSDAFEAYVPLSINFLTQENQAFCGVASIVMVLNALQVPAPTTPEYEPYRTFTQDNFLDARGAYDAETDRFLILDVARYKYPPVWVKAEELFAAMDTTDATEAVLPREVLRKQGMTLDEVGRLLALHPVEAEVHHAADSSLEAFRAAARRYLDREDGAVIVNYLRKAIGQERGGHISPLGHQSPRP